MNTNDEIRRLNLLIAIKRAGTAVNLADIADVNSTYLSQIKNKQPESKTGKPKAMGDDVARKIEIALNEPEGWMDVEHFSETGNSASKSLSNAKAAIFSLESADETIEQIFEIEYWDARGSCGGDSLNGDAISKGKMVKEASWFNKFRVRPHDAVVVYADGDSMTDFIIDGDMVIFDSSKTAPKSGAIFLIEHPDGLRIKQLRREIDGTWILESRNPDKRKFPDERIQPSHEDLLVIKGQFIYRQGGI